MLWSQVPEVPDPGGGGGTSPWLVALAIIMPVVGVVVSAWLGARRQPRETEQERELRQESSAQWEARGRLIDELLERVNTITQARDAAVQAAEDAHAHRIAAQLARDQAVAKERECRTELEQMRQELAQLRQELEQLRGQP